MIQESPAYFKENIKQISEDENLRRIVRKATSLTLSKRSDLVTEYYSEGKDWEALRNQAHEIRKKTIDNLDTYLTDLEDHFERNGIEVKHAINASEACSFVLRILKEHNTRLVVKSKSMVTEEIHLNDKMIEAGIEVVETDLGEYIIQLAGETPSHITAPAMHKSRDDIGKLFSEKLGVPFTNDPAELTAYARRFLREKFLKADVGISGANFLIAETGTVVIIENEGNARLSTTLPKLHIVITGIEKVVPTLEETATLLKLLPVSATGQKATSYVSFINSPAKVKEDARPGKIIVILLDNGRKEILRRQEVREALYCIKCGACMNVCPVYQTVSGHAYGSVYPGPIGSILTPFLTTLKESKDLAYGSSLCGACSEICPVKIDIHNALLWIRSYAVQKKYTPFIERMLFKLWRIAMENIFVYNFGRSLLKFLQPLWSDYKDFPPLAEKSFHQLWKEGEIWNKNS
ncbi:MAG: iron-sulfur cluster-binding protein [Bacteroidetes bacterium]|nr:iron-sulfur cluster-binding protein [Bacteroidota bacterium]MBU1422609.1 iron-sulfur cluster-binding protein [Bacteroidota bacterium]MBU2471676.1 iron-sulfur cluster-binding protein [Bacteroidota bacterium]MBU2635757.1 iron-sulfur cluster-binding protein [Bacteroidota bacterium]